MYGKHFESMYTGSMCGSGALVFAVWGYVISHQKPSHGRKDFFVELNPGVIAYLIGEPEKDVAGVIRKFCEPDPKSRTDSEEGRKLVEVNPYLYRVVNGEAYDKMQREEDRRDYNRERLKIIRGSKEVEEVKTNGEKRSTTPELEEVKLMFSKSGGPPEEAEKFFNFYSSKGWMVGKTRMKSVPHAVAGWILRNRAVVMERKRNPAWDKTIREP